MSTFREIVYMVLDEVKNTSDDAYFTEEHVMFSISKIRALLLKQQYSNIKKQIPESNYQTLDLDLIEVPAMCGEVCMGDRYLRSKDKVPFTMTIGTSRVYPINYYYGNITLVSRDRMRYVGYNKYLQNVIYASIAPDGYLYLKSNNPQFTYLERVKITAIFQDALEVAKSQKCINGEQVCDVLDTEFPLEDAFIPQLIEAAVKELLGATYRPVDDINNHRDDTSDMMSFIRQNMKSNLQKQLNE